MAHEITIIWKQDGCDEYGTAYRNVSHDEIPEVIAHEFDTAIDNTGKKCIAIVEGADDLNVIGDTF